MKKVLITGANSYIGMSFESYVKENYPNDFEIDTVDMIDGTWREKDFSKYDVVFHVAGIAHSDNGKISPEKEKLYYAVNTDLTIETAQKAKEESVKQFIFMSSAIVYGESAPIGKIKRITKDTPTSPANCYGDSKVQAENGILTLDDDTFRVVILRPPMIYGKDSKGNYPILSKLARKLPVFPYVKNERSMLYVESLMLFVKLMIDNETHGIFWPQNAEYSNTSELVQMIADVHGKKVRLVRGFTWALKLMSCVTGLVNKAFGSLSYDQELSQYQGIEYQTYSLRETIKGTETEMRQSIKNNSKSMLMLASVASMIDQFNMDNILILQEMGYKVDVACNFEVGSTCSKDKIDKLKLQLKEMNVDFYQIDFTRSVMNFKQDIKAYNQVKKIVQDNGYNFIHCHSPIGGVIGRLVAHRTKTKVMYTAHGFHFYEGSPMKNWVLYYPIEKFLSIWTDVLLTINQEDFRRASDKFFAKKTLYIPGVGVNIEKFDKCSICNMHKRTEFDIPEDAFVLLSVGELQARKNQKVVLEALKELNNQNIYYLVVGQGELMDEYEIFIDNNSLSNNIKLLGFRTDIPELCKMADCFIHPSVREGLGIAPLEAMASGLPLISSYVNGIKDYTEDGVSGCCLFNPTSKEEAVQAINKMYSDSEFRRKCTAHNKEKAKEFDIKNTNMIMKKIYEEL